MSTWESLSPGELANAFADEHLALSIHNADSERAIRLKPPPASPNIAHKDRSRC